MTNDEIVAIEIDENGRMLVRPYCEEFPFLYREGLQIGWNDVHRYLFSLPIPQAQSKPPLWWFCQIIVAAREEGCRLMLSENTKWTNVDNQLRENIISLEPLLRKSPSPSA